MGLSPVVTGTRAVTTTPTDIDSTGYFYHHVKIFFTHTFGISDSYAIEYYEYDSVTGTWVMNDTDVVDYESIKDVNGVANKKKCWEINPTPGSGLRVRVYKLTGADGTLDYEVVKAA